MNRQTYTTYKNPKESSEPAVDDNLYKTAFKKAKKEDRIEVLTNTFHLLNLSSANSRPPGMYDQ